jgi:HprK-related kinase A
VTAGELSAQEFAERLGHPGITLDTGAFTLLLHGADIEGLAEDLRFLYDDFPIPPPEGIVDFRVGLARPSGLRRWWRPQVRIQIDGASLFEPMPLALAYPTLEWSLNWAVAANAHHHLMIHAAVLERNGRALVMPGVPGAGKSTLCAALAHRGWRLLSDEFALLRPADGQLVPWPRPISLKNVSIDVIRDFAPEARMGRAIPGTVKGTLAHVHPPADARLRMRETAEPAWVVFPGYRAGESARLIPLPRARAFHRLAQTSFNYDVLGAPAFEALRRVIAGCDSFEFTYGELKEAVELFGALALPRSTRVAGS